MEPFLVSARKYRPQRFEDVVGQDAITQTLKNAIISNQLAHAYLFCGPRGVGKTTCARIFAKTINCLHLLPTGDPCLQCESCTAFQNGTSLNIYELDAASNNSVEDIRALVDQVRFAPHMGKYKVYIIDEVHMLSQAAFNAFLKTLEEPPPYAKFILATTEKHKILPTILSRCQVFNFHRIQTDDIVRYLEYLCKQEQVKYDKESLFIIAQKSEGGLRDACSIFDQQVAFGNGKLESREVAENLHVLDESLMFVFSSLITSGHFSKILLELDTLCKKGFDLHLFLSTLSGHLRNILLASDPLTQPLIETSAELKNKYAETARHFSPSVLIQMLQLLARADVNFRSSRNPRLFTETVLIQLCRIFSSVEEEKKNSVIPSPDTQTDKLPQSSPKKDHPSSPLKVSERPLSPIVKEDLDRLNRRAKPITERVYEVMQAASSQALQASLTTISLSEPEKSAEKPAILSLSSPESSEEPDFEKIRQLVLNFSDEIGQTRKLLSVSLKNAVLSFEQSTLFFEFKSESNVIAFEEVRTSLLEYITRAIGKNKIKGIVARVLQDPVEQQPLNIDLGSRYKEIIKEKPWIEELRKNFHLRLEY